MEFKLLGRSGLRVSELCLGTMTFGEDWGWGAPKPESKRIFDLYANAGGNFIDTACNYTEGTSEKYVGEFVKQDRERFVVATKYTLMGKTQNQHDPNQGGNHRKNMIQSLERSLKRMGTDYVDLFYLHMWDSTTPIDEVMRGLDDLIRSGKILYVGISDTPAWVISKANTLAELRGWSPFVAVQVPYSLGSRDLEREIFPMANALDLAVTTWGVMGGGVLTGKYNSDTDVPKRYDSASDRAKSIASFVLEIADESGRSPAEVAISWVRQQQQKAQIIPIIGARTANQMENNLGVLQFELTGEQLEKLSNAITFDPGFPSKFLVDDEVRQLIFGETFPLIQNHRN